jgi:hypothetical protein
MTQIDKAPLERLADIFGERQKYTDQGFDDDMSECWERAETLLRYVLTFPDDVERCAMPPEED